MTVVGLGLTAYVLAKQTPDHAARATLPTAFQGVQTLQHERDQE